MDSVWNEAASIASKNITFADIDADKIEKIRDYLGIIAYPTLLIMKDGIIFLLFLILEPYV